MLLLLLLPVASAAAEEPGDWLQLGYRPVDPLSPPSSLPRGIEQAERYHVTAVGEFIVQRNPRKEHVRIYVALPPDDAYQTVYLYRLTPPPKTIHQSRYGFRIAEIDFGVRQRGAMLNVRYEAEIAVGKVFWQIDPQLVGGLDEIPEQVKRDYLIDGPFYGIHDPVIVRAAREAVGEERHPYWMMAKILTYVGNKLYYDLDGQKVSAAETLANGQGSCTEYSFLMLAMARSLGLPARYMSGSVVKMGPFQNEFQDRIYHKIVEVYLPRIGWVPVESTGARNRTELEPQTLIGTSARRMLFFTHEPEPDVAPLDPRRNIMTQAPFGVNSKLVIGRHETITWRRLK